MERLKHKTQLLVTESSQLLVLHAVHFRTGYFDGTAGGCIQ